MEVIRKSNPGAYRQPRWHYAADAESTRTLCGRDVAEVKGDRRGSWVRGRIERREENRDYVCVTCKKKADGSPSTIKLSKAAMKALLARAGEAGDAAFRGASPTPMVVYTPADMLGSLTGGDDGGADPNEPVYLVNEGVCGSAWVKITPGGSRFARWLVKEGFGRSDSYAGGVNLSLYMVCGERYSQSLTRWEAAARAVASVLSDAGITAYAQSRID
jgi:hypothetical protein